MDQFAQHPDLTLQLPRDTYWLVVHNLRGLLPPPDDETPEALAHRDNAAIAHVASMLPGNADEAHIASRCVAFGAYAEHCLRVAGKYSGDVAAFLKCTAQAACMERQARGARSLLQRLQAERRKRESDAGATDRAAWTEYCAIGLMANALGQAPPAAVAEPPPPPPEPPPEESPDEAQAGTPAEALAEEADLYATIHPRRAVVIRAQGGLPEPCDFGPPRPELVHAIVTGDSPTLRALDQPGNAPVAAAA